MKKGYTLIELIITLSILSLITFISYPALNSSKNYILDKKLEDTTEEIVEFINWSKCYVRNTGKSGYFLYVTPNKISLNDGKKTVKEYRFDSSIALNNNSNFTNNGYNFYHQIAVRYDGIFSKKVSLYVVSKSGKYNVVTIKVGTEYVSRKA